MNEAFVKVNPRVGTPIVIELRQNPEADAGKEYAVIATAVVSTPTSTHDLGDELFGVFVADSSLKHLRRTLDIFPTRRWMDYQVRFGESSHGLEVVGSGATYGDAPARRLYNWSPSGQSPWLVREYVAPEDTVLIESY